MDYLYLSLGRKTLKRKITIPASKTDLQIMFKSYQHTFPDGLFLFIAPPFTNIAPPLSNTNVTWANNSLRNQYVNRLLILFDSLYVFNIKLQTLFWLQGDWLLSCLFYLYPGRTLGIDSELKMKDWWRLIASAPAPMHPSLVFLFLLTTAI